MWLVYYVTKFPFLTCHATGLNPTKLYRTIIEVFCLKQKLRVVSVDIVGCWMNNPIIKTLLYLCYAIWVDSKLAQDVQTRGKNIPFFPVIPNNLNLNLVDVINPRRRLVE